MCNSSFLKWKIINISGQRATRTRLHHLRQKICSRRLRRRALWRPGRFSRKSCRFKFRMKCKSKARRQGISSSLQAASKLSHLQRSIKDMQGRTQIFTFMIKYWAGRHRIFKWYPKSGSFIRSVPTERCQPRRSLPRDWPKRPRHS